MVDRPDAGGLGLRGLLELHVFLDLQDRATAAAQEFAEREAERKRREHERLTRVAGPAAGGTRNAPSLTIGGR